MIPTVSHSFNEQKMWGKIWVVETGKTIVNLESREFANKMSIFALIFRNSELPKADLLYKSPHMVKFFLCPIRNAQYCSEN